MARPCCPKCDNPFFASTEIEPKGSNFKLIAIHCNSCGAVVGMMDFFNIGGLIYKLAEKLRINLDR